MSEANSAIKYSMPAGSDADAAIPCSNRQGFYVVIQSKRCFVLCRRSVPGDNDCRNAGPWLVRIAQRGISGNGISMLVDGDGDGKK